MQSRQPSPISSDRSKSKLRLTRHLQIMDRRKFQQYVSILCRYPLFGVDSDDLDDKEMVASHNARCTTFSLHFKTNASLVTWEVAALRKTGGFTIPQNNL